MRDFPSCFGENGVQIADASSSSSGASMAANSATPTITRFTQSLVSCVYQCRLRNFSCFIITFTWTKNLMGQNLCIQIDDSTNKCLLKLEIRPWLFSKRKGLKSFEVGSKTFDIYWDLTHAKFAGFSPEPFAGFYFAIVVDRDLILILGDMEKEVHKKIDSTKYTPNVVFMSKKEHLCGRKVFSTRSQFCGKGKSHDVLIECDLIGTNDPFLLVHIDGKIMMQVKHLRWKFRGNYTILVDGLPVEVYWDVYNWLYGKSTGEAVFLFQTCFSAEKLWANDSISDPSSWSNSFRRDSNPQGLGFSLVLSVWKHE